MVFLRTALLIGALALFCSTGNAWASATSELYRTQGLLSLSEGAHEEALQRLEQAVAADPQDVRAHYLRGIAHSRLGHYQQSIDDFRIAENSGLRFDKLWFELGYAYYRDQQLEAAQKTLSKSIAKRPEHGPSHFYLGLVHYQLGNYEASLAPLQRAMELDPDFGGTAAYLQANALAQLNRQNEAAALLNDAIANYPGSVYRNPMQELLGALERKDHVSDRFDVLLSTGLVSDSNVGLFPDGEVLAASIDDESDYRLELALDLRAYLARTKSNNVSLGYRFFDSAHQDLDEFDVQSHAISADLSHTWNKVTLGLNYQFITADLDDKDFSDVHVVTPNLVIRHNQKRFSLLLFEWRDNDYDLASETGRSGNSYQARYRHYWLGRANRYGYAEVGAVVDDTDDANFNYEGYRLDLGYQHSWGKTLIRSNISYEDRNYDDAVPARDDYITELAVRVIQPLRHGFEFETALVHINNPSSSDVFNYSRTLFSMYLRYRK